MKHDHRFYDNYRWLLEACKDFRNDPELWAYRDDFTRLCERYRTETGHDAADGEIYRFFVSERKKRHKLSAKGPRLPNFPKARSPAFQVTGKYAGKKELISLYNAQSLPIEKLPYTDEFEIIYHAFKTWLSDSLYKTELWCTLRNLVKNDKTIPPKTGKRFKGRHVKKPSGFGVFQK